MFRPILILILTSLSITPSAVLAQAEAAKAFKDGKAAFADDRFEAARDLFDKASQTDTRNAEVFLWLGKAHYQLGEVDKAMAAWQRTLQLAPKQPYAEKMLKALRGLKVETETEIRLIEMLLRKSWLHATVQKRCGDLLKGKSLTRGDSMVGSRG